MMKWMICLLILSTAAGAFAAGFSPWDAPDLNPVTMHPAPNNAPVVLIDHGKPRATLCLMGNVDPMAVDELQKSLKLATGTELPVVHNQIKTPALIIGGQLPGVDLPIEGLAIKTAPNEVHIVGNGPGVGWGIYEFLERYVGVRWYFPGDLGRSIIKLNKLVVPPVFLTDAPVYRKRELWPNVGNPGNGTGIDLRPLHHALRSYDSWPIKLQVHTPNWSGVKDYVEHRPEVFQMNEKKGRDFDMLCYSNPLTLKTYLENIDKALKGDPDAHIKITNNTVTVSPNDAEISCYCPDCRKLWNPKGGAYGSASKIVATFTAKLAGAVQKRWPKLQVIQLAYLNYTDAPDGIKFPDNVHIQICGMPGMALYAQPAIYKSEEANLQKWYQLVHKKVQNWHYICWPQDRTKAVFIYPHTLQKYYRQNRKYIVGSFINGSGNHWQRQGISAYCWLKLLWNPDFNVDAAIDEYCRRMYGPAADSMHKLIELQDRWEKVVWKRPQLTAKNVYTYTYPKAVRDEMKQCIAQARREAAGDELVLKRIDYYTQPFAAFFQAGDDNENPKRTALIVHHADHQPTIDGSLDEPDWAKAPPVSLILAYNRTNPKPKYPTTLRALWTNKGITFGWTCMEPNMDKLRHGQIGRDESLIWWDDCVEMLFDVTGKNEGNFYHFIISSGGGMTDSKGEDIAWDSKGVERKAWLGPDRWTMEVFIPFANFPEAILPTVGKTVTWWGNFTRHRVADHWKKHKAPGSVEEYQRLNTTYAQPADNLADFGPIEFK